MRLKIPLAAAAAAAAVLTACSVQEAGSNALDLGAKGTALAVGASRTLTHAICPGAHGDGARLTDAEARACVTNGDKAVSGRLAREGVDAKRVAAGGN